MPRKKFMFLMVIAAILFTCSGCATMRHPVPPDLVTKAEIQDMSDIRAMTGEHNTLLQRNILVSVKEERPGDFPVDSSGIKTYPVLAISGGGANGAYGAGLLNGWSKEGSRPVFKSVTGVSTGALIAPYAFLGKDYDAKLKNYYTSMSTKDVMKGKGLFAVLFGDSLSSNQPLDKMVGGLVTDDLLRNIAIEHKHGRRLYVGTSNLDAQKLVIWDMGAIAVRGDADLFRRVIVASAAIPVVFPPSKFHVAVNDQCYDELHADGGVMTQVFTLAYLLQGMQGAAKEMGIDPSKIKSKLYMIRNGYMSTVYKKVDDNLPSLAMRSFDTIINSQGLGDAYRIYTFTSKRGSDFNLAFIPPDFKDESKEMFDPDAMKKLFDRGYQDAVSGYKWHKAPPGMEEIPAQSR